VQFLKNSQIGRQMSTFLSDQGKKPCLFKNQPTGPTRPGLTRHDEIKQNPLSQVKSDHQI
jgi:hypothetical protein